MLEGALEAQAFIPALYMHGQGFSFFVLAAVLRLCLLLVSFRHVGGR